MGIYSAGIQSLNGFRLLASLIIVAFHFGRGVPFIQDLPKFFVAGPQMVTFFYVLSGFVLTFSYSNRPFDKKQFWQKRLARIYPLYFVAFIFAVIIQCYRGESDLIANFLYLTFLQSWVPPYPLVVNGPAWFLSGLIFFYFIFPYVINAINKYKLQPGILITYSTLLWGGTQVVLIILLNSNYYTGFPSCVHDIIYYFPLSHLCSFFIGIAGALGMINKNIELGPSGVSSYFKIIFVCTLLFFSIEHGNDVAKVLGVDLPVGASLYAPIFLVFIASFAGSRSKLTFYLSGKPFLLLGEISFSIYILQAPIHSVVKFILSKSTDNQGLIFVIYLVVLVFSSMLLFWLIDKKAIIRSVKSPYNRSIAK